MPPPVIARRSLRRPAASSERERHGDVSEIDSFVRPGFLEEIAGEEVAVARVSGNVAVDLPVDQQVDFAADEPLAAARSRAEHAARGVVNRVGLALAPEQ